MADSPSASGAPVIVAAPPTAESPQTGTPRAQAPAAAVPVAAGPSASPAPDAVAPVEISPPADKPLPDLTIDWADPLMHVASPTRVSVANSVAARFKSAAEQPGSAPQTELIMEAVSQHLPALPDLVLKRRPEEAAPASAGFFVRRAPVQKAEPWQPVYMRPIAGEIEALRRIVDWVNEVILDGHPGRQKTSRSEVVTAALDASYPAAS
ncbi:hypothetical protein [[Mycobacterium] nativiensis]|uniref:Uncharacterized protein n=1 Tax=[Mycobacterium] nativiensis TaxID=2855503 RepID=A0ABU5XZC0_9MYCO|nr:hypothetical protein [Mycolicibacter sp. MYC340]MEB3033324.1 hypothetical protein [Mycolicibacter sp. MYC340]